MFEAPASIVHELSQPTARHPERCRRPSSGHDGRPRTTVKRAWLALRPSDPDFGHAHATARSSATLRRRAIRVVRRAATPHGDALRDNGGTGIACTSGPP